MNNKFTTYLLYAIGEIILVVVGILIAVSIDDWNERKEEINLEQKILLQLESEYQKNLQQLEEKMLMRDQMIGAAGGILNYIDHPEEVRKDSLLLYLGLIIRDPTFDPILNDLIPSGNLHLIRNDTLKQLLSNWSSEVYQVQELELEWQKVRTEIVIPFTIKVGVARDIANLVWKDGYTPVEALDQSAQVSLKIRPSTRMPKMNVLLANIELEGIAANVITNAQIGNIQSQALHDRIELILEIINRTLDY